MQMPTTAKLTGDVSSVFGSILCFSFLIAYFAVAAQAESNAQPASSGIVVVTAGDISCSPHSSQFNNGRGTKRHCHMMATSDLAISLKPAAVLTLGDNQYEDGALDAYQQAWANNWGRPELKDITYPSIGNHEYHTLGASGYFDYFGSRAGERNKGYYSFNLGTWHLIALNTGSNDKCKPLSCDENSGQEKWLREDLQKNSSACTLAYWHRPLFTSGLHRGATETRAFWRDLYNAHADLVLNGHSHQYERFAAQNPDGLADSDHGLVQFVIGTGGKNLKGFWRQKANSLVRNSNSYGVLKLELQEKSYNWAFISEDGKVLDSGSGECHAKPSP
jgi:acid phosphatase type 7